MVNLFILLDGDFPAGATVVSEYETGVEHNGMKEIGYEPIDLGTLEAALNYVAENFPYGWRVVDGKIIPAYPCPRCGASLTRRVAGNCSNWQCSGRSDCNEI